MRIIHISNLTPKERTMMKQKIIARDGVLYVVYGNMNDKPIEAIEATQ